MLDFLFGKNIDHANMLYVATVEQARKNIFYEDYQVADTIDGRFDMIVLHLCLLKQKLREAGERDFEQRLDNCFYRDMDRNLREMGVGDVTVPKKVKRMAEAYMGRVKVYLDAIENRSEEELCAAITKNIDASDEQIIAADKIAHYCHAQLEYLDASQTSDMINGAFQWNDQVSVV